VANKLVIDPGVLIQLHALIKARDEAERQAAEPLPPLVKAFWEAQEPITPPWRAVESAEERKAREEATERGYWAGL
jgi:hypothetical protein